MLKLCKTILKSSNNEAIHGIMKVNFPNNTGFHQRKTHKNGDVEDKKLINEFGSVGNNDSLENWEGLD